MNGIALSTSQTYLFGHKVYNCTSGPILDIGCMGAFF